MFTTPMAIIASRKVSGSGDGAGEWCAGTYEPVAVPQSAQRDFFCFRQIGEGIEVKSRWRLRLQKEFGAWFQNPNPQVSRSGGGQVARFGVPAHVMRTGRR